MRLFSRFPSTISFITCGAMLMLSLIAPTWSQNGSASTWNDHSNGQGSASVVGALGAPQIVGTSSVASAGTTIMSACILSNGNQQITLFDQSKLTLVVYHVDSATSDIKLKSVRRVDADFQLEEFNLSEPTPSTVRKNVGRM